MLRIDTISVLEEFFYSKKKITLDAIGREASEATIDIYIRGFLRQIMERVQEMAPELRMTPHHIPGVNVQPRYEIGNSMRATPTHVHYPS